MPPELEASMAAVVVHVALVHGFPRLVSRFVPFGEAPLHLVELAGALGDLSLFASLVCTLAWMRRCACL